MAERDGIESAWVNCDTGFAHVISLFAKLIVILNPNAHNFVIPVKTGIHVEFDFSLKPKMDSPLQGALAFA
jgi:hypothetical protein